MVRRRAKFNKIHPVAFFDLERSNRNRHSALFDIANLFKGGTTQIQRAGTAIADRNYHRFSRFTICNPQARADGIARMGRNEMIGIIGPTVGHRTTRKMMAIVGRRLGKGWSGSKQSK